MTHDSDTSPVPCDEVWGPETENSSTVSKTGVLCFRITFGLLLLSILYMLSGPLMASGLIGVAREYIWEITAVAAAAFFIAFMVWMNQGYVAGIAILYAVMSLVWGALSNQLSFGYSWIAFLVCATALSACVAWHNERKGERTKAFFFMFALINWVALAICFIILTVMEDQASVDIIKIEIPPQFEYSGNNGNCVLQGNHVVCEIQK